MRNAKAASGAMTLKREWRVPKMLRTVNSANAMVYAALTILTLLVACAIVPQWMAPYSPTEMFTDRILQKPGAGHLLGTDYFGRDVLSLVIYGSRDSLLVGTMSVVVGGLAGGLIGSLSGYAGGFADKLLMRIIDVLMTIPGILLALAIAAAMGPSLTNIVLAIAISSIPGYARVMRGQVMSIKGRPFIAAARSIGVSPLGIFIRHVLPNSLSPLLVMATLGIGGSILAGAGLSFLGLGTVNEVPDWGALLSQGRGYLTSGWWICVFPGLAITLLVLSVNLLGDRLRDYWDPKRNG